MKIYLLETPVLKGQPGIGLHAGEKLLVMVTAALLDGVGLIVHMGDQGSLILMNLLSSKGGWHFKKKIQGVIRSYVSLQNCVCSERRP